MRDLIITTLIMKTKMKKNVWIFFLIFFVFNYSTLVADTFILSSVKEAQTLSEATEKPILSIFGAESCRFCSILKNDLGHALKKDVDNFIVCYIDIKSEPALKEQLKITSVPNSRIIEGGKVKSSMVGYKQDDYKKWLQNAK